MNGEGAADEEDFAGFYVRNEETFHAIVSMFVKLDPSNPKSEVSQVDVEKCINALENESSDEEIVTEKFSWAEGAGAYSTLLKFAKIRPCYSAQEVMQLHILHSTFQRKRK
jgi:hypothetical protein